MNNAKLLFLITPLFLCSYAFAGGPDTHVDMNAPYIGAHGGVSLFGGGGDQYLDAGYVVGAEAGYRFCGYFRVEGAFDYLGNDFTPAAGGSTLNAYTLMANLYYDIPVQWPYFNPYVGAGAGYYNATGGSVFGGLQLTPNQSAFAYQGSAGLLFNLPYNLKLNVQYRLLGWDGPQDAHFNFIQVGLQYYFV